MPPQFWEPLKAACIPSYCPLLRVLNSLQPSLSDPLPAMFFASSLDMFLQDETTAKPKLQNVVVFVRIAYHQRLENCVRTPSLWTRALEHPAWVVYSQRAGSDWNFQMQSRSLAVPPWLAPAFPKWVTEGLICQRQNQDFAPRHSSFRERPPGGFGLCCFSEFLAVSVISVVRPVQPPKIRHFMCHRLADLALGVPDSEYEYA